jgi:hypothetical protein
MSGQLHFNALLTDFNQTLTHCLSVARVYLSQINIKTLYMKNILLTGVIVVATITLWSSFTIPNQTNKGRHARKIEKSKIDTVSDANTFPWKGDTLMPSEPDFEGREIDGPEPGFGPEKEGYPDLLGAPDERDDQFSDKNDPGENRPDFMPLPNDWDQELSMNDHSGRPLPPLPPMPPDQYTMPEFTKSSDNQHSSETIDLNSPNIISFSKKSLSGHLVKIEIILREPDQSEGADLQSNDKNLKHGPGEFDRPPIPGRPDFNLDPGNNPPDFNGGQEQPDE